MQADHGENNYACDDIKLQNDYWVHIFFKELSSKRVAVVCEDPTEKRETLPGTPPDSHALSL